VADDLAARIQDHTCLFSSFDRSPKADISRGSGKATLNGAVVHHDPVGGRTGGALVFTAADHSWVEDECVYAAEGNFPYSTDAFDGTISLWLNGDPDADLNDTVPVDPFHISRTAGDASFYLDLTKQNDARYGSPRKLRFGFYNDKPEPEKSDGQLLVVGELGWKAGTWHHIVATFRNANSGKPDGAAALYIDGVRRAWTEGYRHQLTWDIADLTIGLGQRYAGRIDELLILDRALSAEEVQELNQLESPLVETL